jgi:hypothetical protein
VQAWKNPKEILIILDEKRFIVARWNLTNQIKYVGGVVLNDIYKGGRICQGLWADNVI